MRTIRFLLKKEFLQIFRNKALLPLIFAAPLIQLLVLSNAANYEIYNLQVHVMDFDHSPASRELISKFEASPYFEVVNYSYSDKQAHQDMEKDQADLILRIPRHFERDILVSQRANVQLLVNAINGSAAGLANAYANSIILDFSSTVQANWQQEPLPSPASAIQIAYSHWYNPRMNYKTYMVPGILVVLITMIGMFLTAMNIVREKEAGTIEQVNVTPIRKYQFIIGKLLPFWLIALFELTLGLLVARFVFTIPMVGSVGLIFSFASIYLLLVLGLGLLISTFTETMQQAMFICFFFMIIFILMSGLFTPIESMPQWAQRITWFNPIAYFVEVMRLVMLKGATFEDISRHFLVLLAFGAVINGLAIFNYRKTL